MSALSEIGPFHVVEVDYAASDALQQLKKERPDTVVIDLGLPGQLAIDLTREVTEHVRSAKVIALGYAEEDECLFRCIEAGVHGCVLDDSSVEELRVAIDKVITGETFCSPQIVHTIFHRLARTGRESHWQRRVESVDLTPRELEVLHLVAERLSNKEIAKKLCLSLYTVKNHVHNILEKLQVEDRHEAVDYARDRRWLKKPGSADPSGH